MHIPEPVYVCVCVRALCALGYLDKCVLAEVRSEQERQYDNISLSQRVTHRSH